MSVLIPGRWRGWCRDWRNICPPSYCEVRVWSKECVYGPWKAEEKTMRQRCINSNCLKWILLLWKLERKAWWLDGQSYKFFWNEDVVEIRGSKALRSVLLKLQVLFTRHSPPLVWDLRRGERRESMFAQLDIVSRKPLKCTGWLNEWNNVWMNTWRKKGVTKVRWLKFR